VKQADLLCSGAKLFAQTKAYVTELLARRPTSLSQLKTWFRQTILGHVQTAR